MCWPAHTLRLVRRALPGCASQGETMDELLFNLREAIQAAELLVSL
jgi:hypothetical protein